MSSAPDNLVVRQYERLNCSLRAEISVEAEHGERIILSAASGESGGAVPVTLTDLSAGGLGVRSTVFFPKLARLCVRVFDEGNGAPILEAIARVQRVQMLDRTPTYYIGGSFVGESPALVAAVKKLMDKLRPTATSAPSGAGAHS